MLSAADENPNDVTRVTLIMSNSSFVSLEVRHQHRVTVCLVSSLDSCVACLACIVHVGVRGRAGVRAAAEQALPRHHCTAAHWQPAGQEVLLGRDLRHLESGPADSVWCSIQECGQAHERLGESSIGRRL